MGPLVERGLGPNGGRSRSAGGDRCRGGPACRPRADTWVGPPFDNDAGETARTYTCRSRRGGGPRTQFKKMNLPATSCSGYARAPPRQGIRERGGPAPVENRGGHPEPEANQTRG